MPPEDTEISKDFNESESATSETRDILYPALTWDYFLANGKTGIGIYAARNIRKGKMIFSDSIEYTFADVVDGDAVLLDRNKKASKKSKSEVPSKFPLTRNTLLQSHGVPHYIPDPTGQTGGTVTWQLEVPGMLMNHSCDPNVKAFPRSSDKAEDYASRDIRKGDELTVDYALQYYDEGPLFEKCLCGAENCRGEMMGFVALSDADKERLLPFASDAVRAMHMADAALGPPVKKQQEVFAPRVKIDADVAAPRMVFPGPSHALADVVVKRNEDTGKFALFALKDFKFGEQVYEFWCQPWPYGGSTPLDMVFASPLTEGDPPEGTVIHVDPRQCAWRDRYRRYTFSGWDLLTAHSCDPNLVYTDKCECEDDDWRAAYAARDVLKGEQLTVDFNCMVWDRSEAGEGVETCNCGANKCVGTQKGFKFLSQEEKEQRKLMSWKRVLPPYEGEKGEVFPGEVLSPHVRVSWRSDPDFKDDAPDTDSDSSSSSEESDWE